jgi:hypothetical protein
MNGEAASGGGTSQWQCGRSGLGPFLDTKTVTSGTSEGSGESIRVSTLPIPRSLRVRYERSRGQRRCFRFQHESGPNGIPHGGSAFTSGSFKAGFLDRNGLTTLAKPVAFNGEGLGVAMTINGIAGGEVEQSTSSAFSSGQSNKACRYRHRWCHRYVFE